MKNPFSTYPKKFVVFIQKAVERKRNTLDKCFYIKKVSRDLKFVKNN